MPYVPQTVPTDSQLLEVMVALFIMAVSFRAFFSYMERQLERKEKEIEEELEEEDETGEVY